MSAPTGTPIQAPPMTTRQRLGLALLLVPLFMTALDMTILFLAIPEIAAALQPSATGQLWVLHVADLASAGLVLTAGSLVNRVGPRRMLVLALLAYAAASLLAAFAPNVETLVLARGLLGAAGVGMMPAAVALLRHMFGEGTRFASAVGLTMAAFSGGMALGPPIGGLLLESFWWGAIFLVNVPVALAVVLASGILPHVPSRPGGRVDLPSVGLSLLAVAALVYGVQELADGGDPVVHGLLVTLGLAAGALFVRRQLRLDEPLLDLCVFRSRAFTVALAAILLIIFATTGAEMQVAQYLQVVLGLSPAQAGLLLVVPAGAAVVGTALAPRLLRWLSASQVMSGGILLAAVGAVLVAATATVLDGGTGVTAVVAGSLLVEIGAAPTFGLGAGLIAASVPVEHTGPATATQEVAGSLGNTLGLALGGSVALLAYQTSLRLPPDLDPGRAGAVQDTVGGARSAVDGLPATTSAEVLDAASSAYAVSTQVLYAVAAVLLVALAVLVWYGLRGVRLSDDD